MATYIFKANFYESPGYGEERGEDKITSFSLICISVLRKRMQEVPE